MQVTFYNFSKRINSTKTPTGGSSFDCILKEGCSILNPEIMLDVGQSSNPTSYNYMFIPDFQRYYRISWRWENRLWIASGKVDTLSSWKVEISGTDCYIARSASDYNLNVADRYYPTIARITEFKTDSVQDPEFTTDLENGSYVIGVMGASSGQNGGAITYYHVSISAMVTLCSYLLNDSNYDPGQDVTPDLFKAVFNPLQYITSCMWFPFNIGTTSDGDINIGWNTVSVNGVRMLSNALFSQNLVFDIPKHPQASRGDYLNLAPYSEYILSAASFGCFNIDPTYLIDETQLTCFLKIDLFTGTGRISIKSKDTLSIVEEHSAQIGVPIQIGQNAFNQGAITSTVGNLTGAIGSAMSGNILGLAASGTSAIASATEGFAPKSSSIGSNGSIAFNTAFNLIGRFTHISNEDLVSRGRPLCAKRFINQLSGYIMCVDADPEIDCTEEELNEIVSYMNGGFFYE